MKRARDLTSEILDEIVSHELTPAAARSILSLHFSKTATARIRSLLRANNRGALSAEERVELEKYLRVGQLLDLLRAKVLGLGR